MSNDAIDDFKQQQLRAIAALLGVGTDSFNHVQANDRLIELLRVWSKLPGEAEQQDVLAYIRLVARGL